MKYDVLIIGAGVIGGVTARELMRYKLKVAILEKENDVACGASKANSGIIHGGYDPEPETLKAMLNTEGVDLLYKAAKELNVPFENNGSLVCAFGEEENSVVAELYKRGLENGISGMEILNGDEARRLEPALSENVTMALRVTNAGIICPYEMTVASVGNAMDNGAELFRNFEVCKISPKADGFVVKSVNGDEKECRYILNCAGVYSDKIAALIGDESFKIIPRAGEYMLLDKAEGKKVLHTIFQVPTKEGKGILVTPTVDGNLLTGPTASAVSADFTDTTKEGLDTVSRLVKKSVPSVDFRQVITSFSGVRSSEKKGDFIIEPSKVNSRFINVAAIDSPGLTSSVAIAKYAVNQLKSVGLQLIDNPNFNGRRDDPHAFRKMNDEQKNEFIKAHAEYGKIVCRCETVSEGEIRFAISHNPKAMDIDGVKRRTRSGMGRCQGGFCLPFVMKLIAEENGMELSKVTKKGGGSYIADGKL